MPQTNMPEFSTPVPSANRSRFIGVTGNLDNGTAKGSLTAGNVNNSVGGSVYRGAGASSNNFPITPADIISTNSGGASFQSVNSSASPLAIQNQTTSRVNTEVISQVTPALVGNKGMGEVINFPKSTEVIEVVNSNADNRNLTVKREAPANAYVGIANNKTFSVNDLTRVSEDRTRTIDTNSEFGGRVDGAAQGANYTDKFIGLGGTSMTTTQREALPGGVAISPEIGENGVSGRGI